MEWNEQEKNELITRAVDKYLEKRQTNQFDPEPSTSKSVRVSSDESEDGDIDESDESEYEDSKDDELI